MSRSRTGKKTLFCTADFVSQYIWKLDPFIVSLHTFNKGYSFSLCMIMYKTFWALQFYQYVGAWLLVNCFCHFLCITFVTCIIALWFSWRTYSISMMHDIWEPICSLWIKILWTLVSQVSVFLCKDNGKNQLLTSQQSDVNVAKGDLHILVNILYFLVP